MAVVRSRFCQEAAGDVASLRPDDGSGIARVVKTYRELASVTDDIGED